MAVILQPARVTMRDDSLPHQIRLKFTSNGEARTDLIGVFCSCRPGMALDKRARWDDPDEPLRIWARHAAEVTE